MQGAEVSSTQDAVGMKRNGIEGVQRTLLHKARARLHLHSCAHFCSSAPERNAGEIKGILSDGRYFTGKFLFYKDHKNKFE